MVPDFFCIKIGFPPQDIHHTCGGVKIAGHQTSSPFRFDRGRVGAFSTFERRRGPREERKGVHVTRRRRGQRRRRRLQKSTTNALIPFPDPR